MPFSQAPVARVFLAIALAAIALKGSAAPATPPSGLDAAESHVLVEVGKTGALSFVAGHPHVIEGPIHGTLSVDPTHPELAAAVFEISTGDLVVRDEGEPPEDVEKVQHTMAGPDVLDVSQYPTVTFRSTSIEVEHRSANELKLTVIGNLTLHGTTRSIAVPVIAEFPGNVVTARGRFSVKQTDYGMRPVSVAGGLVSVKDAVTIHFTIVSPLSGR
ncbi:MAG: YceI family protein [Acidobacteriota bacterium]